MKTCRAGHTHDKKRCPICNSETQRKWREANPEKWAENRRSYQQRHQFGSIKRYHCTLPGAMIKLLTRARSRLKEYRGNRKRVEGFDIDKDFLLELWARQEGKCAISGLAMEIKPGSLKDVSLDRRDSNIGYLKSNVQLVCKWVNLAKKDYTNEAMLAVIEELRSGKQI